MVDLDDCDKEPIHIPGSIQGYGALVVCQSQTLRIVQVSGNTSEFLGIEPQELLPHNLSEIMSEANFEKLVQATASLREQADSSVAQVSMLNRIFFPFLT